MDTYPIIYDVLEILIAQGAIFTSDTICINNLSHPADSSTLEEFEKYLDFFQLLSCQDFRLVNMNPYLICCSIISTSRMYTRIQNRWPQELVQLTGL